MKNYFCYKRSRTTKGIRLKIHDERAEWEVGVTLTLKRYKTKTGPIQETLDNDLTKRRHINFESTYSFIETVLFVV